MERKISIETPGVNYVCDGCGRKSFEKENENKDFFLIHIGHTFSCMCSDCLSSFVSLASSALKKKEEEREEEREKGV